MPTILALLLVFSAMTSFSWVKLLKVPPSRWGRLVTAHSHAFSVAPIFWTGCLRRSGSFPDFYNSIECVKHKCSGDCFYERIIMEQCSIIWSVGQEAATSAVKQEGACIQGGPQGGPHNGDCWPGRCTSAKEDRTSPPQGHWKWFRGGRQGSLGSSGMAQAYWPAGYLQVTLCQLCRKPQLEVLQIPQCQMPGVWEEGAHTCACWVTKSRGSLPQALCQQQLEQKSSFWPEECHSVTEYSSVITDQSVRMPTREKTWLQCISKEHQARWRLTLGQCSQSFWMGTVYLVYPREIDQAMWYPLD